MARSSSIIMSTAAVPRSTHIIGNGGDVTVIRTQPLLVREARNSSSLNRQLQQQQVIDIEVEPITRPNSSTKTNTNSIGSGNGKKMAEGVPNNNTSTAVANAAAAGITFHLPADHSYVS
jgi:hypothetical protein